MKIILGSVLVFSSVCMGGTEIVYNRSTNPYVPAKGEVTADKVCFDAAKNAFEVLVPASSKETCKSIRMDYSDSHYPKKICVGKKIVKVPAKVSTFSRVATRKVCASFDYSDSTYPKCTSYKTESFEHSLNYTEYTFQPWDYRHENPVSLGERTLPDCF